jgi:two-component system nitrogen regulation sensor histidine kinase NtrY
MSDEISRGPAHGRSLNMTSDAPSDYSGSAGRREAAALRRVTMWSNRLRIGRRAIFALVVVAIIAGLATFLTLTGRTDLGTGNNALETLIIVDIVLVLALVAAFVQGVVRLWVNRRAGLGAARLHVRLVGLFSVVAVAPAILVLVLAALFFNVVVQNWFSDRVRVAVESSVRISDAYLSEHEQIIRSDVQAMAQELGAVWTRVAPDAQRMRTTLEGLAARPSRCAATGAVSSRKISPAIARVTTPISWESIAIARRTSPAPRVPAFVAACMRKNISGRRKSPIPAINENRAPITMMRPPMR